VDLEGVEGWIHRGYLPQHPVNDLSEIVQIGQEIEVMVLENDKGRVELSLVHAQLRDQVLRDVYPGQILVGYILSLSPEGVFVDLGGPLGLIPTDQVTRSYISHPADLFYRTQEVVVRIETIDIGKRVMLSLLEAH
jgi:4-hydroxy-3-methylbut-2-enyl diphosphate reductase